VFDLVKQTQGIPGHLRIMKTYHKRDLAAITSQLDEVKAYGEGTADEWRKGLAQTGKDAMADASRWERWEHSLPLGTVLGELLKEYDSASFPCYFEAMREQAAAVKGMYTTAPVMNGKQLSISSFESMPFLRVLFLPWQLSSSYCGRTIVCPNARSRRVLT
jgi:hypothetical protein